MASRLHICLLERGKSGCHQPNYADWDFPTLGTIRLHINHPLLLNERLSRPIFADFDGSFMFVFFNYLHVLSNHLMRGRYIFTNQGGKEDS